MAEEESLHSAFAENCIGESDSYGTRACTGRSSDEDHAGSASEADSAGSASQGQPTENISTDASLPPEDCSEASGGPSHSRGTPTRTDNPADQHDAGDATEADGTGSASSPEGPPRGAGNGLTQVDAVVPKLESMPRSLSIGRCDSHRVISRIDGETSPTKKPFNHVQVSGSLADLKDLFVQVEVWTGDGDGKDEASAPLTYGGTRRPPVAGAKAGGEPVFVPMEPVRVGDDGKTYFDRFTQTTTRYGLRIPEARAQKTACFRVEFHLLKRLKGQLEKIGASRMYSVNDESIVFPGRRSEPGPGDSAAPISSVAQDDSSRGGGFAVTDGSSPAVSAPVMQAVTPGLRREGHCSDSASSSGAPPRTLAISTYTGSGHVDGSVDNNRVDPVIGLLLKCDSPAAQSPSRPAPCRALCFTSPL